MSPDCTSDQVKAVPILDEQQHYISHSVIFPLVKTIQKYWYNSISQHGKNSGLLYMYAKMAAIRLNKDALVKMVELAVATGYFEVNNWYFNERHHRQLHFCVCLFVCLVVTLGSMRLSVA